MEKKMEEKNQIFSFITGKIRILTNVYISVSIFKSILFGEMEEFDHQHIIFVFYLVYFWIFFKNDRLLYKHQTEHR